MKKTLRTVTLVLFLVFSACISLSSCGNSETQNKEKTKEASSIISSDADRDSEPAFIEDSQTADEFPAGTVPVSLLAETYGYIDGEFRDHYVCERDEYGNVLTRQKCRENSYNVITTEYEANVVEEGGMYYIDTPYLLFDKVYYRFYSDENGAVTSIQGNNWTLTYSDDDNSVFQKSQTSSKNMSISKYDEKYRLVEIVFYSKDSDEPTGANYYTYDDKGRIIQSHNISYQHNYDFDNAITSFCEMDRPLVSYYVISGKKTGYEQAMTEYTCECTYDDAGNVITETHTVKGSDKVDFCYGYAYDSEGNMIEMKEISDSGNAHNIYTYDSDGNQTGYRPTELGSYHIYKLFPVKDDALVLAFLALKPADEY